MVSGVGPTHRRRKGRMKQGRAGVGVRVNPTPARERKWRDPSSPPLIIYKPFVGGRRRGRGRENPMYSDPRPAGLRVLPRRKSVPDPVAAPLYAVSVSSLRARAGKKEIGCLGAAGLGAGREPTGGEYDGYDATG